MAIRRAGWLLLSLGLLILGWQAVVQLTGLPRFILPSPLDVTRRLQALIQDGSLGHHLIITLSEVLAGLSIGLFSATLLGYVLAKSPAVERLLAPYVVASQAVPMVAVAPLLVIWLGPGILSKVLIAALIVFFPVLVNTVVGVRAVPEDLYALMRSLQASRWQILTLLEIPAALPVFFGGLRVGATLAVIGAVVGEFVGADRGLGFLINLGRGLYDTALVFASMLVLIALALALYGTVAALERRLLSWQQRNGY